jgi:hypothetical protein
VDAAAVGQSLAKLNMDMLDRLYPGVGVRIWQPSVPQKVLPLVNSQLGPHSQALAPSQASHKPEDHTPACSRTGCLLLS